MEEKDLFITTWITTKDNQTITLPITANLDGYGVDWGDGSKSKPDEKGPITHNYKKAGTYSVKVTGKRLSINFDNANSESREAFKLIYQWGAIKWTTMANAFKGCRSLRINAKDSPDLSLVTSMAHMFENTTLSADLTKWNVSNVTSMSYLFASSSFNGDISTWNVSKVKDMSNMFYKASSFNGNISNWNVGNVENMSGMFSYTRNFNKDISTWNVSKVKDMSNMFHYATTYYYIDTWKVNNINTWNVSKVKNMSGMFSFSPFNGNINNWDVSSVENMSNMFNNNRVFNQDLNSWNKKTLKVIDMSFMFSGANRFNGDISGWDVSNVQNMSGMFNSATIFNRDISRWDVSNVQNMSRMFSNTRVFNQDLNSWGEKTLKVLHMGDMFYSASSFNGNISNWNVRNVINMGRMFHYATSFNVDIGNWNVGNVEDMYSMFDNATSFDKDISKWNVSNVSNMSKMFRNAVSFNGNIGTWDVSNVEVMRGMFHKAYSFSKNLSNWNVSKVINMGYMFEDALSFKGNISNWNVSNVSDMSDMFRGLKLPQKTYDQLLTNWSKLELQPTVNFGAGLSNYCKANEARNILINKFKWRINDNGQSCTGIIDMNKSEILAVPNNVPIFNSKHSNSGLSNTLVSRIIIQAKGADGSSLKVGGESVKINTSFGQVSETIDHKNGTYSAMVFTKQPGIAQVSFMIGEQPSYKNTKVNFNTLKGCGVRFSIQANQPILQAEGRYSPLKVKTSNNPKNNIKSSEKVSNSESNWTNFIIKDPNNPITPEINISGIYDLQVRVKGAKDNWTKWHALPPFTIDLCKPLNGIAILINKGNCHTPIEYTDLVYVDKNKFKGTITDGLVLYKDFYLSVLYDGGDENYVTRPSYYPRGGEDHNTYSSSTTQEGSVRSVNPELKEVDIERVVRARTPIRPMEFNINKKGVVYNIKLCTPRPSRPPRYQNQ